MISKKSQHELFFSISEVKLNISKRNKRNKSRQVLFQERSERRENSNRRICFRKHVSIAAVITVITDRQTFAREHTAGLYFERVFINCPL